VTPPIRIAMRAMPARMDIFFFYQIVAETRRRSWDLPAGTGTPHPAPAGRPPALNNFQSFDD
jgi:hypothetical protein